jgi:hypothetical protein
MVGVAVWILIHDEWLAKFPMAWATISPHHIYSTASTVRYGLQTPTTPFPWLPIHLSLATIVGLWTCWKVATFQRFRTTPPSPSVDWFGIVHFSFLLSICLVLHKLGNAPTAVAICVNSALVTALVAAERRNRPGAYLAVLSIPLALTAIATHT